MSSGLSPSHPNFNQVTELNVQTQLPLTKQQDPPSSVEYITRAQWLRAAVLGANDGLISAASIMIGVGAANESLSAMLISGLAGLVAGACSMAIGEFVSVYTQYDIELAQIRKEKRANREEKRSLPNPFQAASASALAFTLGAILPVLAGGFIRPLAARTVAVCAVTSVGLVVFGAVGAALGGASVWKSAGRVLLGGWAAMGASYGLLRLFALVARSSPASVGF